MRGGPVILTVVISAALHVALATGLVAVAKNRDVRHRAISVAVEDAKKKETKPKPPAPPKAIVHAAPPKAAPVAAAPVAAPSHAAHAAPVAMNLAMSNETGGGLDVGPGIGLHGRAEPGAAAAPVKVASAVSDSRLKKVKEEAGADAPCEEEPTKPEPVFKTEINYSVYPQAQQDGIEGKLKLRFTVSETGEVSQVDVLEGIDPGLDAAVVAAAKQWRFKPALACGKPVAGGTYVFAARFELGN